MGATTQYLTLRGLRSGNTYTLSFYCAGSDPVAKPLACTFNGAAVVSSPQDFTLPEPCIIEYITGPATGQLGISVAGMPTPIMWDMATVISRIAVPGTNYGRLSGGQDKRYQLVVRGALAA